MTKWLEKRRRFLQKLGALCLLGAAGAVAPGAALARQAAQGLRHIAGRVVDRAHANYELWRASMSWFVYKPARYPDYIVSVSHEHDVVETLRHARDNGLKVAVRGSGHNITAGSLRDGGICLDVSGLRDIRVETGGNAVWIQPGVWSEDLMRHVNPLGFTFPCAHTGKVGLGGYLLGGGLGWNLGKMDIACRSVLAAEIITADGEKRLATPQHNADLLWAVRGAGQGFFGVVVRYKLQLYALPRHILKSTYVIPDTELGDVTAELLQLDEHKVDSVEVLLVLKHSEDIPGVTVKGVSAIVSVFAFGDTAAESAAMLRPYTDSRLARRALVKKEAQLSTIADIYAGQHITDSTSPLRSTLDNMWTDRPAEALQIMAERLRHSPSKKSFSIAVIGFHPNKRDDTAVPWFADHYLSYYMIAEEERLVEPNFAWMDETVERLRPLMKGRYINEVEGRRYPDHYRDCFTPQSWQRLAALRAEYDPAGLFHTYLGLG